MLNDVTSFVNQILDANVLPATKHHLIKFLKNKLVPTLHVLCEKCGEYGFKFSPPKDIKQFKCQSCSLVSTFSPKNVFFATFPIKIILEDLAKCYEKEFRWFDRGTKTFPISDVENGLLHRAAINSLGGKFISLTFNTDGIRLFNTGKKSTWPFLFSVNNLDPLYRFKQDNIVVGGIYHQTNLNMLALTDIIVEEIKCINEAGGITINKEKVPIVCCQGTFDLPARCKVTNYSQFNAFHSCVYCYIEGLFVGGSMKFSSR